MKRQQAVSMKISKYLLKADELYQTYLMSGDGQQVAWNRWGVSRVSSFFLKISVVIYHDNSNLIYCKISQFVLF